MLLVGGVLNPTIECLKGLSKAISYSIEFKLKAIENGAYQPETLNFNAPVNFIKGNLKIDY